MSTSAPVLVPIQKAVLDLRIDLKKPVLRAIGSLLMRSQQLLVLQSVPRLPGAAAAGAVKMTRYRFQLLGRVRGAGGEVESVALKVLEWSWLALLGAELHRTIRTEWLCALAEAENVDLLVWIGKG